MSYDIRCTESDFVVLKPKSALAALKAANRRRPLFDYDDIPERIERAKTLGRALLECYWDVERDDEGRIERVFYEGNLLTDFDDLERFFGVLAPFVRSGSYVVIDGEDGLCFRYVFRKGKLRVMDEDSG